MARIRTDHPRTLGLRLAEWYSRRRFGDVLDPGLVAYNNQKVLRTYLLTELSAQRWDALAPELKALAVMRAAVELGCSWCLDFGYWDAYGRGVAPAKLRDVPHFETSPLFSPLEKLVMTYAAAMTRTPAEVTDELVDGLREHLDEAQLVELAFLVALENLRSRVNLAAGLTSQGFSDRCGLPSAAAVAADGQSDLERHERT